MKVLVTTPWVDRYVDRFRNDFPQVEFATGDTPEELASAAAGAKVAIGPMSEELFEAAPDLRWIQSASAGVEWMQRVPSLIESDVTVTNTRGAHADSIAEHTMGMLLFLARQFGDLYQAQQRGEWLRPLPRMSVGLKGATMGIIGLGHLGRTIGERAHGFGMKVIGVDAHNVPQPDYLAQFWMLDGLDQLLEEADVVVVAVPITEQTRGMLGRQQLERMKQGSFLVVISRGNIVDETTVIEMLKDGRLAGAGLDVTSQEPLPSDHELWKAPNLLITPHCSPSASNTHENVTQILRENLERFLEGKPLLNEVNKKLGY